MARHSHDDGVWLGGVDALDNLPGASMPSYRFDDADPAKSPHLDLALTDAAAALATLRAEQRRVLLHCVHAQSRTPIVATLYGARLTGRVTADVLADVLAVLPDASPNSGLRSALDRLG